jgi:hypothetical protein
MRGRWSSCGFIDSCNFAGVLAQLVERENGIFEVRGSNPLGSTFSAGVTQLVECDLPKIEVASSNLVTRFHSLYMPAGCRSGFSRSASGGGGWIRANLQAPA